MIYIDDSKKILDNSVIILVKNIKNIYIFNNDDLSSQQAEGMMTQAQIKEYLEKAEAITNKAISSKAEARKLLTKGGFCTKNGQLKKQYRDK